MEGWFGWLCSWEKKNQIKANIIKKVRYKQTRRKEYKTKGI
jgi:hypothetical protein